MKKEWFASWFDTTYYHTLYKNRNEAEAKQFLGKLTKHLDLQKDSYILDLACGKGRHSITLNELGYNVLGVDLSPNSISTASKSSKEGLSFSVHDMREKIPNEQFDAIFNLFTSFGYFDDTSDNSKVLRSIHAMLRADGILVIDFMNARRVVNQLVEIEEKTVDGIQFFIKRSFDGNHIFKNIQFQDQGESFDYTERVQALFYEDFLKLLSQEDFQILSTFGNFDLEAFEPETSDRLIIVAKKV